MTNQPNARRPLSVRLVGALLAAVGVAGTLIAAVPAPVRVVPVAVADGELQWGVKTSFRSYIEGPIAHGSVVVGDQATRAGDVFEFPAAGGTFDGTSSVDARFAGSVHFTGHDMGAGPVLNLKFSDLRVTVAGTTGALYADATYAPFTGPSGPATAPVLHDDVLIATLDLTGITPTSAGTTGHRWSNVPAVLTAAGVPAFGEFYPAGTALDPVSFTVSDGEVPQFRALAPARLLDTRQGGQTIDGEFRGLGARQPGSKLELRVTGRGAVPAGAAAVSLNVTVAGAQGDGYVTVWPCDAAQPNVSSLNFVGGQTVANAVFAKVGAGGLVCLYVAEGATNLIADVNGYFPSGSAYSSLSPARLLDTRAGGTTVDGAFQGGGPKAAGSLVQLQVADRGGVAPGAAAAVLNVTVAAPGGTGYVTVYPCGTVRPNASSLNFVAGQTVPNAVVTKIGTGGKVCIYLAEASAELIVDVNGAFPAGSDYTALTPARLADTRQGGTTVDGAEAGLGRREAGTTLQLLVVQRGGVPANATSVVLNVTADGPAGTGYVTVYPCDVPRPNASSLNFVAGRTTPNVVVSQISVGGTVCIYVAEASTNLIVDVVGAFTA